MQFSDLRPAQEFAQNFGVKAVVYGGPGVGKSPICINTTPNAVVLMCEPGFLSLRKSTVPTFPAFNAGKIDEFFTWLTQSQDARRFDTVVIDSVSQMAELLIEHEMGLGNKSGGEAHGLRAYGKMSRQIMKYMNQLYFAPAKHVILIAKQQNFELNGSIYKRPYFPGKELPVRIPHLFDLVMQLGRYTNIPGAPPSQDGHVAFRTKETYDSMGRDRSGNLAEYELPNLSQIIIKCMS